MTWRQLLVHLVLVPLAGGVVAAALALLVQGLWWGVWPPLTQDNLAIGVRWP